MTMSPKHLLLAALPFALAACSITQHVAPISAMETKQVCVVVNPAVFNEGFLQTYERVLIAKGYQVRRLPVGASLIECPVVSTYTANWKWDMAMYMNYAEIKVYNNAKPVGEAIYDSRSGGANMGKFIKAENKITELVNELYPGPLVTVPGAAPASGQAEAPR